MPNEIIIYRNPMEAALWQSFMQDPAGVVTIVLVFMFVSGFLLWMWAASADTVTMVAHKIAKLFCKLSERRYYRVFNRVRTIVYTVYVIGTLILVVKVHNWLVL